MKCNTPGLAPLVEGGAVDWIRSDDAASPMSMKALDMPGRAGWELEVLVASFSRSRIFYVPKVNKMQKSIYRRKQSFVRDHVDKERVIY